MQKHIAGIIAGCSVCLIAATGCTSAKKLQEARADNALLTSKLDQAVTQRDQAQKDLQGTNAQLEEARSSLARSQDELAKANGLLSTSRDQLRTAQSQVAELQKQLKGAQENLQARNVTDMQEIILLKEQLETAEKKVQSAAQENADLRKMIDALTARIEALRGTKPATAPMP